MSAVAIKTKKPQKSRRGATNAEKPATSQRGREALRLEWVPAGQLAENPQNWRRHPDGQVTALSDLINDPAIGWAGACLYNERTKRLIDGHARKKTVDPTTTVPVLIGSWSEEAEAKILATLDPLAAMAEADPAKLKALLQSVALDGPALEALAGNLNDVIKAAELKERMAQDIVEDQPLDESEIEARCKPGDLWVLGNHRLLCGDSTKPDDVARLLAGAKPFIMVTDPPYGVEYDPGWRNDAAQAGAGSMGAPTGRALGKVENDNRSDWTETYNLFPGDVGYVWHGAVHAGVVATNLTAAHFTIRAQIVGAKPQLVIGRGHYHWQHEPCWYAVRNNATAKWVGDRKQSTLWQFPSRIGSNGNKDDFVASHGTQKPVECMLRPIRNHGDKGDDVYEPFCGSGTTIIAAEQLGRRCFAIEIAPNYCDMILARWEKFTGKKAARGT